MTFMDIAIGFVLGVVVGAGGFMAYLQWRTRKQLAAMEDQMGAMLEGDLDFPAPDDLDDPEDGD